MSLTITNGAIIISAYLLGSLCSAIIVCRIMGLQDPRLDGSNNPGATNVKRLYGSKVAAVVLAGDMLKGLIPVVIANIFELYSLAIILGMAVFIGHLYPIFFRFQGGKGLATMLGVMFGLSPLAGVATTATWLLFTKAIKNPAISVLMSATMSSILAPVYIYYFTHNVIWVWGILIISIGSLIRHKSNFQRVFKKSL